MSFNISEKQWEEIRACIKEDSVSSVIDNNGVLELKIDEETLKQRIMDILSKQLADGIKV